MRGALPLLIAFLLPPLAAQDSVPGPGADLATYESFFRLVTSYKGASDTPALLLNGEPVQVTFRKLQDIIGLTDPEVDTLLAAASECLVKVRAPQPEAQAQVLELRLQMIESGQPPDARSEAVEKIDREHDNIVVEHIQQLKAAYGEARFKVLDDYVRSRKFRKDLILAMLRRADK